MQMTVMQTLPIVSVPRQVYGCLNDDVPTGSAQIDNDKLADVIMYNTKINAAKLFSEDIGEFNLLLDIALDITLSKRCCPALVATGYSNVSSRTWRTQR